MKPIVRKLSTAVVALLVTVAMVVTASYAWYTLSDSPVVGGMQVSIGGGDTILIAPDLSTTDDGTTYHYPGYFKETLIFSQYKEYDYLKTVAGLTPVSTSDGVHWFMAECYDYNDPEVQNGTVTVGTVKPISQFSCDTDLTHANLTSKEGDLAKQGSYVFLDFWVVSPGADCTLRVSTDASGDGSFLLETKDLVKGEDGNYTLAETSGAAAASARVGFLVCQDWIVDEKNLAHYRNSLAYNPDYEILKGMYQQKGEDTLYTSGYRFTVYEPNADLHPDPNLTQDAYYVTSPVGYEGGEIVSANMRYKMAVQHTNRWYSADMMIAGAGATIDDEFAVWWQSNKSQLENKSAAEIKHSFYAEHLQWSLRSYVKAGNFVPYAAGLYDGKSEVIPAGDIAGKGGQSAGATQDTHIVHLERNVPQRIRMFIWLEGQDVDCQNLSQVLDLVLSIELAGGSR